MIGRDLRHADAQDLARGADDARPDADEDGGDARLHEVLAGAEADGVADDDRHRHLLAQLLEAQALEAAGAVTGRRDGRLDDEDVDARLDGERRQALGAGRRAGDGAERALSLDLADALADELRTHRLGVDLLEEGRDILLARGGDLLENAFGVVVARLQAVDVEDGQAAELGEDGGGARADDGVHSGRQERQAQLHVAQGEGDVGKLGVDRDVAGNDGDLVEAVGAAHLLGAGRSHASLFQQLGVDDRRRRCGTPTRDGLPANVPHCAALPSALGNWSVEYSKTIPTRGEEINAGHP